MTSLRFCMVTTFYPPHNFGGDGIGVRRLVHALARRGHRVTVVHDQDAFRALHSGPDPTDLDEPPGVDVIRLRSGIGMLSPLLTQQAGRPVANGRRLRGILDDGNFDVIQYNNVSLVGGPGILSIGDAVKLYEAHEHWLVCPTHVLWRHKREVCTGRQCLRCSVHYRRPPQVWRYTGLLDRQLSHVDTFIAKSEFSRAKHREFGFPRDMEVLPYFLPDRPDPAHRREDATPHDRPYFLFVGRLERIKGLDEVIPHFDRYGDADLIIAGDGEHAQALKGLARGARNVRFLGRIAPEELDRYYRHALALIVPSVCFETFGIIIIEAFRHGTPVIARRIGPFPEIIERAGGGELFESTEELFGAMRRLQGDPERRAHMGRAAYDGFHTEWSESAVVPRYLDLVRRAAAEKGRHSIVDALETAEVKR